MCYWNGRDGFKEREEERLPPIFIHMQSTAAGFGIAMYVTLRSFIHAKEQLTLLAKIDWRALYVSIRRFRRRLTYLLTYLAKSSRLLPYGSIGLVSTFSSKSLYVTKKTW